jgi:flagellar biosynthesis protein FlhA
MLDLDEIHVEFAEDLIDIAMDEATGIGARIQNMRNHIAGAYGIVIPEIRLTDSAALGPGEYAIRIQGVEAARAKVEPSQALVLLSEANGAAALAPEGQDVSEPVYGAPARWITVDKQEEAALLGLPVITPTEVVATHLLETIKENFGRLFSRRSLRKLLEEFVTVSDVGRAEANRKILDEFIPDKVSPDLLQQVVRLLLEERVSVRNLPLILEAIAEARPIFNAPEPIAEHVRRRLGFQLVAEVAEPDGAVPLIQLSPDWEDLFMRHETKDDNGVDVALPPSEFNRLAAAVAEKIARASAEGRYPAVVTSARRRRFVRTVLSAKGVRNPVLSFEEIGSRVKPAILGMA